MTQQNSIYAACTSLLNGWSVPPRAKHHPAIAIDPEVRRATETRAIVTAIVRLSRAADSSRDSYTFQTAYHAGVILGTALRLSNALAVKELTWHLRMSHEYQRSATLRKVADRLEELANGLYATRKQMRTLTVDPSREGFGNGWYNAFSPNRGYSGYEIQFDHLSLKSFGDLYEVFEPMPSFNEVQIHLSALRDQATDIRSELHPERTVMIDAARGFVMRNHSRFS